jgi:uncharacterized protein (TIGR00290 family)
MKKENIWLSWSSGKDCAYALHCIRQQPQYEVTALLTSFDTASRRVAMHGTPEQLLQRQAEELELPIHYVEADQGEGQQQRLRGLLREASQLGVAYIAFGDLFLEEIRAYREEKMKGTGIELLFPLWKIPTNDLAYQMVRDGFKAIVTSVDLRALSPAYLGRSFDAQFLQDLPPHVDPCGENGEFHTFVYDGPIFRSPISLRQGGITVQGNYAHLHFL